MKIIIATGGTGGHIYPALALADAAMKKDSSTQILFVGNKDRMEAKEIPQKGYAFIGLKAKGMNGNLLNKVKAVSMMGKAYVDASKVIKQFKPDIAIGFGGYVSAPVMMAAHHHKVKVLLHEQNSLVGAANKLCAKFADGIAICYEKCFEQLPANKVRLLGNPRASLALTSTFNQTYYQSLQLDDKKPLILVVMGSLGSTSVNTVMQEVLPELPSDIQILFVVGKGNLDKVHIFQDNIKVVEYIDSLAIIEKVTLMICRAGATTAAEICAFGVPSILVPSPYVANNHQFYNASVLVEQKCALMIEEKDLNAKILFEKCTHLLKNKKLYDSMKQNCLAYGYRNATTDILNWCDELIGE